MTIIFFGTCSTTYSINLFRPTFAKTLHPTYSARHVQILVVPILVVAGLAALLSAYLSDRSRHSVGFAQFGYLLSSIGFILLLEQRHVSDGVKYTALYFVMAGSYMTLPLLWTMLANNVFGKYKLAFAIGLEAGLGNCGGIFTSLIFPQTDAPLYKTGFSACLGLLVMSVLLMWGFLIGLYVENGKRRRGQSDHRLQLPAKEVSNLGDDHPSFRFVY